MKDVSEVEWETKLQPHRHFCRGIETSPRGNSYYINRNRLFLASQVLAFVAGYSSVAKKQFAETVMLKGNDNRRPSLSFQFFAI